MAKFIVFRLLFIRMKKYTMCRGSRPKPCSAKKMTVRKFGMFTLTFGQVNVLKIVLHATWLSSKHDRITKITI